MSRIVSPSAYLLFYRRRSDVPLGGPKIAQIVRDFDNDLSPQVSDDDVSDSGEGKGLVGNSSLRGSSSALTGVGAARHQQSPGFPGEQMMTIDPSALTQAPGSGYGAGALQPSIEEDEAIDMRDERPPAYNASEWGKNGFSNLENLEAQGYNQNSRAGSIAASDDVNHGSSPDRSSLDGRLAEFNNAEAEGDDGPFVDPSPVPDMDDTDIANTVALQHDIYDTMGANTMHYQRAGYSVTAVEDEILEVEEPVTEIHLKDSDELKMD